MSVGGRKCGLGWGVASEVSGALPCRVVCWPWRCGCCVGGHQEASLGITLTGLAGLLTAPAGRSRRSGGHWLGGGGLSRRGRRVDPSVPNPATWLSSMSRPTSGESLLLTQAVHVGGKSLGWGAQGEVITLNDKLLFVTPCGSGMY